MKKTFIAFAVAALVVVAFAFTRNTAPQATNADLAFKATTLTTSGTNKACTINSWSYEKANYYMELGDSVTLTLSGVKDGGDYTLLVKKTVSGVCTLTFSGTVVGTTSPLSLSGSTNSYFWINYTKQGTTTVLLKQ